MRRHPWAIFVAVAVLFALGSSLGDPVPTRTATENRQPQQPPPPARPSDRVLTRDRPGGDDGVAHAAERHTAGRDTFGAINRFILNAIWVGVACLIAWVLWEALLGPVRWRQRRN